MKLEGIHHITAITADAQQNVDFYADTLGLRLVKKTVNQDDPTVYHLFYADEEGDPGSDLTFFEYPGAPIGRAGDGMIHRIVWRVGSKDALEFWAERLEGRGTHTTLQSAPASEAEEAASASGWLRFADPEGLEHELAVIEVDDEPLSAEHPEIPAELALQGFDGARAYSSDPRPTHQLLEETLGFEPTGEHSWEARGERRHGRYAFDVDEPPPERGLQAAGTVHHIAWASEMEDHEEWRSRVLATGAAPTPVIDRFYFRSIYFREPSGVLFEIATLGPGFTVDEPLESLGERLSLPPDYEHLRDQVEPKLTPITNPRTTRA
jgi:glyoxalase family protein